MWKFFKKKEVKEKTKIKSFENDNSINFSAFSLFSKSQGVKADKDLIHIAVAKIAENIASIDFDFYKLGKNETPDIVSEDNAVKKLLTKPSKYFNQYQFIYKWVGKYIFTGEVAIYYDKDKSEMHILDNVLPIWDKQGFEIVKFKSGTFEYSPEEIFYTRVPDFFNNKESAGKIEKINGWIEIADGNSRLMKRYQENGTFLGGVLSVKTKNKEELSRISAQIQGAYSGVKNAFKLFIAPEGSKLEQFTGSAKDIQANETDERNTKKLLLALGVPLSVLGDVDGKGRANVEGAFYGFSKFTLMPIIKVFVDLFNNEIIPKISEKDFVFMDYTNPVPEDEEQKSIIATKLAGGKQILSVNEARKRFYNLGEVENGDSLGENQKAEVKEEKRIFNIPKRITENFIKKKREIKNKEKRDLNLEKLLTNAVEEIKAKKNDAIHEDVKKRASGDEKKIEKNLSIHATILKEKILKKINIKKGSKNEIKEKDLFDIKKEKENLRILNDEVLEKVIEREGEKAMELVKKPKGSFDINDKDLKDKIEEVLSLREESYLETTRLSLTKEINEGMKAGENSELLAKRVENVMGARIGGAKAKQIAQDIIFSAINTTVKNAYKQSGVVKTIKWNTAGDKKTCSFCRSLNGKVVKIEDVFFNKGDEYTVEGRTMQVNFETIENPPIHSNCRCFLLPEEIKN